ncbi:MAG: ABC transporter ATP-binding protein [Anaerolineaceae bacterium]|nr:ABC transporter ATP-binding protein [Anaerolineaceae bacterium]
MTSSNKPGLQVENLCVSFIENDGTLEVLDDITFSIEPYSFVSMIGPSGGGKSTLLKALSGLKTPSSGKVLISSSNPEKKEPKVGMVFQQSNLMPWRTVLQNIMLPLELEGISKKDNLELSQKMIAIVGLEGFENSYPHDLSGGMAQRVAIARSLVHDPDILLLDEPFGLLDALTREKMGGELLRIWHATKKTVLMVTHSITEAVYLSDRVLVLTSRPARISLDLPIDLERPRNEEMRYTPHYSSLLQRLRQQLDMNSD